MEDVKAMKAVFTGDLMKDMLSQLSVQPHGQIVAYWQQKSKEWLSTQQFMTHMGRDCMRTMAVHFNEWGITYDDLRDTFEKCKTDETVFHSHLLKAGVARRPWRNKLWQHFSKNNLLYSFSSLYSSLFYSNHIKSVYLVVFSRVNNFIVNLRLLFGYWFVNITMVRLAKVHAPHCTHPSLK